LNFKFKFSFFKKTVFLSALFFILIFGWIFTGWPPIGQNQITPEAANVQSRFLLAGGGNFRADEQPKFRIQLPAARIGKK